MFFTNLTQASMLIEQAKEHLQHDANFGSRQLSLGKAQELIKGFLTDATRVVYDLEQENKKLHKQVKKLQKELRKR